MIYSNFDSAIDIVLRHEGGFSNHKNDPGGATNYGISLRFLSKLDRLEINGIPLDKDGDGDIDADDMRLMDIETAKYIYKSEFWDKYEYDSFDYPVAVKIFDMAVNLGPRQAHMLAQRAANLCGADLVVDGILGPKSRSEICAIENGAMVEALRLQQLGFYNELVRHRPMLSVFLNGWRERAKL